MDDARLRALIQTNPEEAMALLREMGKYVVHPHAGQRLVLDHPARFKVVNCGRRWGKTVIAAKAIVAESRRPSQMLWWVAPTYRIVKRGYEEVLKQLPPGALTHEPPPSSNFDAGRAVILRFKNRTKMEFYSAERPEGMLGAGVDYAVLDEAATMPPRIWNQIVRPTLMDRKGEAMMISTPRGMNWFYQAWLKGQDGQDESWASWTFTSHDNPTLPEGEIDDMKRDLPTMEYEQEVLAKFLAAGSRVFTYDDNSIQYSIEHDTPLVFPNGLIEGYPPAGSHVVLGIDLAKTHDWTVLYGARASDRRNVYYERMQAITWPEQKRRIRRAHKVLRNNGATSVTLIFDSTGVGDPIYEDLEAEGYDAVPVNFSGQHKPNMVKLLAKDLEERKAFILPQRIEEFEAYAMAVTPGGRFTYSAPEGQHDDVVSAKMLQHHGLVNEGMADVTVISASAPSDESAGDPFDGNEEWDAWDDLVDDDGNLDDPNDAAHAAGYDSPNVAELLTGQPTMAQLLTRGFF